VDFILHAANDALHTEFGTTLSQPEVHLLDLHIMRNFDVSRDVQTDAAAVHDRRLKAGRPR
jgi:predicted helicase